MRKRGGQEDSTNNGFLEALSFALGLGGSVPLGQLGWPQRVGMGAPLPPFQPSEHTKNQKQALLIKQVP